MSYPHTVHIININALVCVCQAVDMELDLSAVLGNKRSKR